MSPAAAKGAAIYLVIGAVPSLLTVPAIACAPVGGELPGINCFAWAGLAALVSLAFAFALGLGSAGDLSAPGRRRSVVRLGCLVVGGLVALTLLARLGSWVPGGTGRQQPFVVIAISVAFAVGWLLRAMVAAVSTAAHRGQRT